MSLQRLIEKLNRIIDEDIMNELEVDPKFKDAMQASRDFQTNSLQKAIDDNNIGMKNYPDDDYYKRKDDELQAILKGKRSVDYVYRQLAAAGLSVDKATIEFLGNCKDLDSTTVRRRIKEKIADNEDLAIYLIADTQDITALDTWHNAKKSRSGFLAWKAEYYNGSLSLTNTLNIYGQSKFISSDIKGKSLMAIINSNDYPHWNFYLAYGPSTKPLQRDRENNKSPYDRYDLDDINDFNLKDYDKSGYRLDIRKNDLMKRLKEYKKNKGSYSDKVTEVQNRLDEMEATVKQILANTNPRDNSDTNKLNNALRNFGACCAQVEFFIDAINRPYSTAEDVNERYEFTLKTFDMFDKEVHL